ncbi:sensor histidine kinase [Sporomusa aerivorans]|uniref:sensor histidine kinase n=1 Tax=Sporomusa aerivorans TaxID=204936 RepID=UPI00352B342D
MSIKQMKWFVALLAASFIGAFEFIRHQFLHVISMEFGNVLVAVLTGVLVFICFHGMFALLENLYAKLQKEKEGTAVLQERYRIARGLHDSVAQALFFMNIKMTEIETALRQQREPWAAIGEVKDAIRMTDADIRQHIFVLQQVPTENINLLAVIRQYIASYETDSGMQVELKVSGGIGDKLSPVVKNQLFRVFQELMQNIRKHASAKQVHVNLRETEEQFSMEVRDNGKGFSAEIINKQGLSFGLKLLENDIRAIGGRLELASFPGLGTTATISLNLQGRSAYDN